MKYKIIVAEDDYFYRRLFVDYFNKMKEFELFLCKDAFELERTILKESPHVAILDYHLPGKKADEVIASFKEKNIIVPVIVITGDESISTERTVRCCNVDYFFVKPINFIDLENVLWRIIDSQKSSSTLLYNDRKNLV